MSDVKFGVFLLFIYMYIGKERFFCLFVFQRMTTRVSKNPYPGYTKVQKFQWNGWIYAGGWLATNSNHARLYLKRRRKWETGWLRFKWSDISITSYWLHPALWIQALLCHDLRWSDRGLVAGHPWALSTFKVLTGSFSAWGRHSGGGLCCLRVKGSVGVIFNAFLNQLWCVHNIAEKIGLALTSPRSLHLRGVIYTWFINYPSVQKSGLGPNTKWR